jgi:hypothetical protein
VLVVINRPILAILGGFITTLLLSMAFLPLERPVIDRLGSHTVLIFVVQLVFSLITATAGGYVTARLSARRPMLTAAFLAAFFALSAIVVTHGDAIALFRGLVFSAAVLLGALLRVHQLVPQGGGTSRELAEQPPGVDSAP